MKYSKEQIKKFADANVNALMNEPIQPKRKSLNIEVAYQLSGEAQRDSEAIRNANPNSRLFKAALEPMCNDGAEAGLYLMDK